MDTKKSFMTKRRTYFIEKKFQGNFILKFCILICTGGILTIGAVYFLTTQSRTVVFVNSQAVMKTTADFLLPLLIETVAAVTVLISLAAIIVTLFISHRIAGPLYRLKKVMGELSQGNFSGDFKLRSHDQLQDIAVSFNTMIVKTREKLNKLESDIDRLTRTLENISDESVAEQKLLALKESKNIATELNAIVHYFRV